MIEFFTNGNGWLVAGLALIILEIIGSLGYVSISFGLGSIATGLLVKLGTMPTMFASTWADELLVAAICSLLALLALRHFFRRTPSKDINEY
jgi:membrane protein implicated in regulation of membrane protease activity